MATTRTAKKKPATKSPAPQILPARSAAPKTTKRRARKPIKDNPRAMKKSEWAYTELKPTLPEKSFFTAAAQVIVKGRKLWDRLLGER